MKKIIYVYYIPLSLKREKDFFLQELIDNGIEIEYWDLSGFMFKDAGFASSIKRDYVVKLNSIVEFEKRIVKEDLDNVLFVSIANLSGHVAKIYRIFTKNNCKLLFFARPGQPSFFCGTKLQKYLDKLKRCLNLKKVFLTLYDRWAFFLKRIGYIKEYDVVMAAGNAAFKSHFSVKDVVPINYFDYDEYLRGKIEIENIMEGSYCVFLDDNIVYDPDYKMLGLKTVNGKSYYRELNSYFDHIEKSSNCKVVIAAHPKSNYENNEFNGRKVIKLKSNQLVQSADFVLAHYSTSVSYAVLHMKPVVFIYTDEMKNKFYFGTIINLANSLGCTKINISSKNQVEKKHSLRVDEQKYNSYKFSNLTSVQSLNKHSSQIYIDFIKNLILQQKSGHRVKSHEPPRSGQSL